MHRRVEIKALVEIKAHFGDSIAKKNGRLERAQITGEYCTTYVENVLKLSGIVYSQMFKKEKVGHLLEGSAEDTQNFFIGRDNFNKSSGVIRHCQHFETLNLRRNALKFGRLPNVTTVSSCAYDNQADMAGTIRRIARTVVVPAMHYVSG
ncbi:hypothetical protein HPB48_026098 [Haemaphysalis longicornis]|uniref:Uncharacterized protein n=1 Tax=Haemaphysalis longicornis TaxID=44386 RepID=A0A9J6HB72_HAELO|nr:hypothetical protein HPB48_026098 [Haemaphysalis longicornis]